MGTPSITVLLVEDDDFLSSALLKKLTSSGYNALHAPDGQVGLTLATEEKPDLIITDVMMPVMDGIEMLRQIRAQPWGKDIPAIVLTNIGFPGREVETDALEAEYMVKANCHLDEIMQMVEKKLQN